MVGIEIWRNGERLCTAALKDGIITARLIIRNQVDPIWFDADGRDATTGGHVHWAHIAVEEGDQFTLKLVEVNSVLENQAPAPNVPTD
ncbi:MAG TPA: hypothetical protein VMP01_21890 [Pirellulaceae bacterium]|nr:hypothetical protein [Pirellulaceae bacterium]